MPRGYEHRGVGVIDEFGRYQAMRGFSHNTVRRRRGTLRRFVAALEPRSVGDATLADVEAFLAAQPSPATRQALLGDIRAFYRWGTRRGLVACDPTADVDGPRVPKRTPNPLTRAELAAALELAEPRTRLMLMLGAYAGLRVAEIGRLHERDIDRERGTLTVRAGKGGKDRSVPLYPALASELQTWGTGGYLVGLTPTSVSRCIHAVFLEAGIDKRPHDLRALFGTEAAERSNGNLVLVAQLMGHVTTTTTQRYVGWTPDAKAVIRGMFGGDAA